MNDIPDNLSNLYRSISDAMMTKEWKLEINSITSLFITVSTPPTNAPVSTIENSKDWMDIRSDINANNTIFNGHINSNSVHVSEKSMLISFFPFYSLYISIREVNFIFK